MTEGPNTGFAQALLRGLAELGPVAPFSGDLSLELGLSLWLRRSGTSVLRAREALVELRRAVLDACELDAASEPVPLVGRSPRADVVTLATYLAELLQRAAAVSGCGMPALVVAVIAELPEPAAEALGA